jgi:hypothetical protein
MRYLLPLMQSGVRLANAGTRAQLVVPNYTRVYPEADGFKNSDGAVMVFVIDATPDQVNIVPEGATTQHLLWKGAKGSRENHADLVSVTMESLIAPAPSKDGPALAEAQATVQKAGETIAALSAKIQLVTAQRDEAVEKLAANYAATEAAMKAAAASASAASAQQTVISTN